MTQNRKAVQWLLRELPELEKAQVIDQPNAEALRKHYEGVLPPVLGTQKIFAIFLSILSAALIGCGIILLIAHNWDNLPRTARTVIAFIPLTIALFMGAFTLLKDKDERWREASAILLAAGSATAISLVSQIYHLGGILPDFLFTWMLLIFLPVYLFNSGALLFVYLFAFTAYDFSSMARHFWGEGLNSHRALYLGMFIVLILPYVIWHLKRHFASNRTVFYNWLIVPFVLINFGVVFNRSSEFELQLGFAVLLTTLYLTGMELRERNIGLWRNPFLSAGFLGSVIFVAIGTFPRIFWRIYRSRTLFDIDQSWFLLIIIALMMIWSLIIVVKRKGDLFMLPLLMPILFIFSAWMDGFTMSYIFSTYMLLLGVALLIGGYKTRDLLRLNLGMLVMSLLILLRFLDSELSILFRGCVFIAVGIVFALVNLRIGKAFKTETKTAEAK